MQLLGKSTSVCAIIKTYIAMMNELRNLKGGRWCICPYCIMNYNDTKQRTENRWIIHNLLSKQLKFWPFSQNDKSKYVLRGWSHKVQYKCYNILQKDLIAMCQISYSKKLYSYEHYHVQQIELLILSLIFNYFNFCSNLFITRFFGRILCSIF